VRGRLAATLALAGPALLALGPAAANATTYCVANPSCVNAGGTSAATVQGALTQAQTNAGPDRVEIGAGTFVAPSSGFAHSSTTAANSVEIVGAGADATTLSPPAGPGDATTTLTVSSSPDSVVRDLRIGVRSANAVTAFNFALDLFGTARNIKVTTVLHGTSVVLRKGATLADSNIDGGTADIPSVSIVGADARVTRTTIANNTSAVGAQSAGSGTVTRSRLIGGGASASGGVLRVTDSTIEPGASGFLTGLLASTGGTLTAQHVTVDGRGGSNTTGATAFASSATDTSTVNIESSVLANVDTSLERVNGGSGVARISVDHSSFDPAKMSDSSTPGSITQGPGNVNVAAGFVDSANGDYRLRADSALIDAGDPAPEDGLHSVDLAGNARLFDGTGDGVAVPDIGALEFSGLAPTAVINGPARATAGAVVTFSADGSSDPDPGDPLSYSWRVRGADAGSGQSISPRLRTPGRTEVTLTVRDRAGHTSTATLTVLVSSPPVLTAVSLTNKRFAVARGRTALTARTKAKVKRGTKIRFTLSKASSVSIAIRSVKKGKVKTIGTLKRRGKAGKNSVKFTGRLGRKALAVGSYRAVIGATDAAGNKAKTKTLSFKIVKG
jgi:hypothetical protein